MSSVMIQGTTLPAVAKLFHVSLPEKIRRRSPLDIALSDDFKSEFIEIEINAVSPASKKKVMDLGFPKKSLIVLINRNNKYLTPNGSTIIEPGDKLLILAEDPLDIETIKDKTGA